MASEENEDFKARSVYVSWSTFKTAIEQLSQGIPNQIDKSVFPKIPWGVQPQLLTGLKFLGLTDDKERPTPALHELAVSDEAERKRVLERILRERYADLFALDLAKTTPDQLASQVAKSYGATGETREKAVRFFLGAAAYLGIPLSPLLQPKSGNGGGAPRKRRAGRKARPAVEPAPQGPIATAPMPQSGDVKVVRLTTPGVELTITVSTNFGSLNSGDRKLVFKLFDELEEYERGNEPKATQE